MAADLGQVAHRAGVSVSTASRALRDLPSISEATKARVRIAAAELDYTASPSATSLATGRTRSVGVVLTYVGRWFFGQVLGGAQEVLRSAGYDVLLYGLPSEAARTDFFAKMPLRRRVDGVLLITVPCTGEQMGRLHGLGLPISAVGIREPGISTVNVDDHEEALAATTHLINLGHRRIAMIGGGPSELNPFTTPKDRQAGFRTALTQAGLDVDAGLEVDGKYTIAGGWSAMAQLLAGPHPPTAVFCQSDRMAMGAMGALRAAGLSCPGDVSVVGVGDEEIAAPLGLTTISQSAARQGELAATSLLDQLEGGAPTSQLVKTRLILRASTRPPAGAHDGIMIGAG